MDRFKKIFRILSLIFFLLLAAAGAGLTGAFLPSQREPYQHKDIRIELVDKKDEEEEEISDTKKPG